MFLSVKEKSMISIKNICFVRLISLNLLQEEFSNKMIKKKYSKN